MQRTWPARAPGRVRTGLVVTGGVVAVIAVVVAVLSVTVLPPVLTNFSSVVADPEIAITIPEEDGPVSLVAPGGWVVQRSWLADDTVTLRSPDGALEVTVTAHEGGADTAWTALAGAVDDLGTPVTETLASGGSARHATSPDGTLIVVVGFDTPGSSTGNVVGFVAHVDGGDSTAYLPSIATLLDSTRVTS